MEFSVWCLMTSKETDVLPPITCQLETLLSLCCSNKSWIDSEFRTEHSLQTGNLEIIFKRYECLQHVKQLSAVPQPTNKMSGKRKQQPIRKQKEHHRPIGGPVWPQTTRRKKSCWPTQICIKYGGNYQCRFFQ